jgi:hypothetical protein
MINISKYSEYQRMPIKYIYLDNRMITNYLEQCN